MDRDLRKFFRPAKQIRLTGRERLAGCMELIRFVKEYSPPAVRESVFQRPIYRYMFASIVAVLLLSSVTAVAAENSLPGSVLFPIKKAVTEPVRLFVTSQTNSKTAAEGKMTASENKIEEVEKYIQNKKDTSGVQATADAEAKLELAKQLVAEGEQKLEAGLHNEAFLKFQEAHRLAQEAKQLVKSNVKSDVESKTKVEQKSGDEKDDKEEKQDSKPGNNKADTPIIKNEGGVKLELELPGLLD